MGELVSGTAVFRTELDGRICEWNPESERLTGVSAREAEGRLCWEVVAGLGEDGHMVCHPGCSIARLARQGWPVRSTELTVRTRSGPKRLVISTIVLHGDAEPTTILHALREQERPAGATPAEASKPRLTPRQRQILLLLVEGVRAKEIAGRLVLSETTVRNHIRAILSELGVHSQLEAVASARKLALLRDEPAA